MRDFFKGMRIGVYMWYRDIFKFKVPMWVCWVIGCLLIPVNIITVIIWIIKDKRKFIKELENEVYDTKVEMENKGLL